MPQLRDVDLLAQPRVAGRRAGVEEGRPIVRLQEIDADDALDALVQQIDRLAVNFAHSPEKRRTMLIATTNEISGYEIDEVFGEVFGLTVRSRNMFSQFGAGLKSMVGGELKGMTKALHDSRQQVIDRMSDEAEAKGANAIAVMRFDASDLGNAWTEICAYGTAVRINKV